ncbi:hypothetical protein [Rossellomorea sp. NRS-1567]|uniref:hypothetical protein n=1 Tax=Rossellomorea sp. NRS-1567 TaxID=3233901 RepID=UPI003D2DB1F0
MSKVKDKGDDPMNKIGLLKSLNQASRGNFFSIDIPMTSKEEAQTIENLAHELEKEGKIKIRECDQNETSVYIQGIIKYALT